eukprot:CAMPEP_0185363854 /NCGR_PEP_ID=MMETSP1364-20130426/12008_1 /TAXON_ID=38817 /ORGANISM="Gephyrocapsa oceanica, Strain RCC1303" /LENGTH=197 /DNA_ID=CAMNT_0027964325 /DNA_START=80 /DNA_END=673 /DNA_ORIENTATION=+
MPRTRAVVLCLTLVVGIDAGSPRPPHPRVPRRGVAAERSLICCQQDTEPAAPPPLTAFALASAPATAAAAVGEGWFVAVLAPFLLLANTVEAPPFAALLSAALVYDAGAALLNHPAGPLAVTAIASLGFAALSARVADDASQRPAPISAAEARERADDDTFREAKRRALSERKSWDARLQWRLRKRRPPGDADEGGR